MDYVGSAPACGLSGYPQFTPRGIDFSNAEINYNNIYLNQYFSGKFPVDNWLKNFV